MNLNSDSTKLIKNWLLKVPLDELRKRLMNVKISLIKNSGNAFIKLLLSEESKKN